MMDGCDRYPKSVICKQVKYEEQLEKNKRPCAARQSSRYVLIPVGTKWPYMEIIPFFS